MVFSPYYLSYCMHRNVDHDNGLQGVALINYVELDNYMKALIKGIVWA